MEGKPPNDERFEGSWDDLVRLYAALVFSVIRRFDFDEATNHDLFQKVWLVALEKLDPVGKTHAEIRRFLVAAAFWVCRDHLKSGRRKRETTFEDEIRVVSIEPAPLDVVLHHEEVAAFWDCFRELREEDRTILRLLFLDPRKWTYAEIGEAVGIPPVQVGPRRIRAMRALLKCLRGKGFRR